MITPAIHSIAVIIIIIIDSYVMAETTTTNFLEYFVTHYKTNPDIFAAVIQVDGIGRPLLIVTKDVKKAQDDPEHYFHDKEVMEGRPSNQWKRAEWTTWRDRASWQRDRDKKAGSTAATKTKAKATPAQQEEENTVHDKILVSTVLVLHLRDGYRVFAWRRDDKELTHDMFTGDGAAATIEKRIQIVPFAKLPQLHHVDGDKNLDPAHYTVAQHQQTRRVDDYDFPIMDIREAARAAKLITAAKPSAGKKVKHDEEEEGAAADEDDDDEPKDKKAGTNDDDDQHDASSSSSSSESADDDDAKKEKKAEEKARKKKKQKKREEKKQKKREEKKKKAEAEAKRVHKTTTPPAAPKKTTKPAPTVAKAASTEKPAAVRAFDPKKGQGALKAFEDDIAAYRHRQALMSLMMIDEKQAISQGKQTDVPTSWYPFGERKEAFHIIFPGQAGMAVKMPYEIEDKKWAEARKLLANGDNVDALLKKLTPGDNGVVPLLDPNEILMVLLPARACLHHIHIARRGAYCSEAARLLHQANDA